MNPSPLFETTMDPSSRKLMEVKIGDKEDAEKLFTSLMGSKPPVARVG
jgi:DNA gyrase subunit B